MLNPWIPMFDLSEVRAFRFLNFICTELYFGCVHVCHLQSLPTLFIHGWHPQIKRLSIIFFHGWHFYPRIKSFHPWMIFTDKNFIHGWNSDLSCFCMKILGIIFSCQSFDTDGSGLNTFFPIFTPKHNK